MGANVYHHIIIEIQLNIMLLGYNIIYVYIAPFPCLVKYNTTQ